MSIWYMDPISGVDTAGAPYETPYGWWCVAFTGGSGTAPVPCTTAGLDNGEVVTGATSGSTAKVSYIGTITGSWAGNDAAGTMYFYGKSAAFQSEQVNCAVSGHFHIGADFTYCAWKTITSGATAARTTPGDTIRIRGNIGNTYPGDTTVINPSVVSLGVNGTWTNASATVTLASAVTSNVDTCAAVSATPGHGEWKSNITNATATVEATIYKEGSGSIKMAIGASFDWTDGALLGWAHLAPIAAATVDDYTGFSFWIYSSVAVAANAIQLALCSGEDGTGVLDSFTIPFKLEIARWYPVCYNKGSALTSTEVNSVALISKTTTDVTTNLYIDNIFLHNGFSLQSLLGRNVTGEGWWGIKSIDGVTITLGGTTQTGTGVSKYYLQTGDGAGPLTGVTTYRRETIKTTLATSGTTLTQTIQEGGTFDVPMTYIGGWSNVTNTRSDATWFDGLNAWGYGLSFNQKTDLILEYLGFVRYNYPVGSINCPRLVTNYISCVSNAGGAVSASIGTWNYPYFGQHYDYAIQVTGQVIFENPVFISNAYGLSVAGGRAILYSPRIVGNNISGANYDLITSYSGQAVLYNAELSSDTGCQFNPTYSNANSWIKSMKENGVTNNHKTRCVYAVGTNSFLISLDSVLYKTAAPSTRIAPNNATYKAQSATLDDGMKVPVASGATVTVHVWVRKSHSYNGNHQRLIVRRNDLVGYTADTVLATASGAVADDDVTPGIGWEELTGTTDAATSDGVFEFIIDGDGTAGFFCIDDWHVV